MVVYDRSLKRGMLEVHCGPMRSGKTLALIHRVDKLRYRSDAQFVFFKPKADTRDAHVHTRFANISYPCQFINSNRTHDMLRYVHDMHQLVAIDEAQFFSEELLEVIEHLLKKDKNVVVAGLDLNFRGEPFGIMGTLLALADEVHKHYAICQYDDCGAAATRTQRLVNGAPARYDSPVILIGDAKEGYEPRCIRHHEVPGKPTRFEIPLASITCDLTPYLDEY